MSVLPEIKSKLDSISGLGTIVSGSMPATPHAIGVLREYGGLAPDGRFGVTGVGYERPSVQLIFRGEPFDYSGPRTKAEIAWRALAAIIPGALGSGVSTEYLTVYPQQSPFSIAPMDVNSRYYIGCNFYITKVPS